MSLSWSVLASPVGPLTVVAGVSGVRQIAFAGPEEVLGEYEAELVRDTGLAAETARQLDEYFARRRREFDVPIEWEPMQGLRLHVLRTLFELVPFGEAVSYKRLAELSGRPEASRAVGTIMGSNPIPLIVPCHRVLASGGGLGGFGPGLEAKRKLLVLEGIIEPSLLELDLLES
ncbi:methylated-DNA-[protein]-cysteine S-methyltransferase [Saccharopolyspora antimicrobica]|uniref:methylated-DNA--[protein]-cysteine S-methyltransferase n=1 Tax=Saccharopolyspora antimicrobica TaxID=455193 RepID=A0A1I5BG29_9PSEU|nr:methylated-DNA--[protein]-cysteine S-methyltransferase [Saccharopolyspora antimicrobica]RKT86602.1 methylated-DNA-[protein]-cysteine S-methyltransferase [Saccharopolyspora antimicrobica]SFN73683.1 methylated-DNA-[protein]-cysteine S-methyltransferase [Saccharopolyspora antimicrobica]